VVIPTTSADDSSPVARVRVGFRVGGKPPRSGRPIRCVALGALEQRSGLPLRLRRTGPGSRIDLSAARGV